jgi:hypothetical protein
METPNTTLNPSLMLELFLLKRDRVVEKVNSLFDGKTKELCIRTRYPKEIAGFISACLAQRGELESGAGLRCSFVSDKVTWYSLCSPESESNQILIANPELDFDSARSELLPPARLRGHAVIYCLANPRPDNEEVVTLNEPEQFDVRELLKKHEYPAAKAEQLAKQSNGNIYILTRLLTGTNDRPEWAKGNLGYQLRSLALIGGWSDSSAKDRSALAEIVGESYDAWAQRVYPLTKREEPPVLLDGNSFRPVSRYESWQQLGHFLTDSDLRRFQTVAEKILGEISPQLELSVDERHLAGFMAKPETFSTALQKGIAESLALLGGQGSNLQCTPNLARGVADQVVFSLFNGADWKRWASLTYVLPQLAEAAPTVFLDAVDKALIDLKSSPFKEVFGVYEGSIFGQNYHCGLLWALEVLAWYPDYLSRVAVALTRLAQFPLPPNAGNNPTATLRSIFLTWLPQTLASVDARLAAIERVIQEDLEVGWRLLLGVLPDNHQMGTYNQKPAWRDWFPSDWSEGTTRSIMYKQVQNYTNLAVNISMGQIGKLTELISRWDHLPREIFQKVLDYLESPEALTIPDNERFAIWEKLTSEISRHRKYAHTDWAMPEEEVQRLEKAALAIKPEEAAIVHQRLFNSYDHDFYVTDNYADEEQDLAKRREDAVSEVLSKYGPPRILEMAKAVNHPTELGSALGRIGNPVLDEFLLPCYLEDGERKLVDLMRGYAWSRYFKASIAWVKEVCLESWTPIQKGLFFSYLPFTADVWRLAEERLGAELSEYWSRIRPNPFQARGDILEAAEKSLVNKRPEIAIDCLNTLKHENRPIPSRLATDAVKQLLTDSRAVGHLDHHNLLEVIKHLQSAPDVDVEDMTWIEFQCLGLLDRFSGGSPVFLERRMATEPSFFHDIVKTCFRSEQDRDKPLEIDEQKKAMAEQAYRLLHNWHTPPGTTTDQTIDEAGFSEWIDATRILCEESGHWTIAQEMIGHSLTYHPAGLQEILKYPAVAKCLDALEHEHMRRGLATELFNSRGVHGFSGGKEELDIAKSYRSRADQFDLSKFTRIATSLRGLAEGYERDAERDAKRDPFSD